MRRHIQFPVILSLLFAATLVSCSNFGKKVKIEGTKAEVFYKDGATEDQAQKVGDFLKEDGFLGNEKAASIQVAKENGEYTVRFVYNKEFYDKTDGLDKEFKAYAVKMSKEVFAGEKVNIALADNQFKDFKKIPFEEEKEEISSGILAPAAPPGEPLNKETFDHDTAGGVTFFWKGISDKESKVIEDYIVENGGFAGGTVEIYMTKDGDRYLLQFPVKKEYRDDPALIAEIGKLSKQIKENVFPNESYTFQMTDEKLNEVKSFDY